MTASTMHFSQNLKFTFTQSESSTDLVD